MPTKFQQQVWHALNQIPKGKVCTYGDLANFLQTKAVRAVGTAVGKNPDAPKVPCHRVVLSNGNIGNYTNPKGVAEKIRLLKTEDVIVKNKKIQGFENIRHRF